MIAQRCQSIRKRSHLHLEVLEDRSVPAIAFDAATGVLTLQGGLNNDVGEVRLDTKGTISRADDTIVATLRSYSATGALLSTETREERLYSETVLALLLRVRQVSFYGSDGQDRFTNNAGRRSLVDGGFGNDTLVGGSAADTLRGGFGDDSMSGLGANDNLDGSFGNDTMNGGAGHDTLNGSFGNDQLNGNSGDDRLYGGHDHDTLKGGSGNDSATGSFGNDKLEGELGDDTLDGGSGNDMLHGQAGYDRLYGSFDNDRLYGGDQNDLLDGGDGNDGLFGGGGHDDLYGRAGADRFLVWNPTPSDLAFATLHDLAAEDAQIHFDSGIPRVIDGVDYSFASWTAAEVERMDEVLDILHRETGSTTLLERSDGRAMHFQRNGTGGRGWNFGDFIILTDGQLGGSDNWLHGYTLHEIGHNWNGNQIGRTRWRNFKNMSWTSDGMIRPGAVFASEYAKNDVNEDWAESFAAYFQDQASETFYNRDRMGVIGADAIPDKIALIDAWVDTL